MLYEKDVDDEKAWQKMLRSLQGDGFSPASDGDPKRFRVLKQVDTGGTISFCPAHKTAILTIPEDASPARRHLRGWGAKQRFMEVVGDDPSCTCAVHRLSADAGGE